MNITKEFHDYMNYNTNLMISPYKFKYEKYSPMHKCSRLLRQIKEVESNLDALLSISKKSSSFNDSHLKFSSASIKIKKSLMEIESEMKKIKEKDIYLCQNNFSKKIIINSLDILNQKISDLSQKFQKFLQTQAATIKRIEDRKYDLSKNNLNRKINTYNEYTINYENNNYDDEDVLLNVTGQTQTKIKKNDMYYANRLSEAQAIEKTMGEINGMMNRLSQITYDHTLMIDNISQNTDIALGNVERGAKEVKEILENVKGNRGLMLRIFFIIIVVSVVYILFFA
jgi:hypothetical protein